MTDNRSWAVTHKYLSICPWIYPSLPVWPSPPAPPMFCPGTGLGKPNMYKRVGSRGGEGPQPGTFTFRALSVFFSQGEGIKKYYVPFRFSLHWKIISNKKLGVDSLPPCPPFRVGPQVVTNPGTLLSVEWREVVNTIYTSIYSTHSVYTSIY